VPPLKETPLTFELKIQEVKISEVTAQIIIYKGLANLIPEIGLGPTIERKDESGKFGWSAIDKGCCSPLAPERKVADYSITFMLIGRNDHSSKQVRLRLASERTCMTFHYWSPS